MDASKRTCQLLESVIWCCRYDNSNEIGIFFIFSSGHNEAHLLHCLIFVPMSSYLQTYAYMHRLCMFVCMHPCYASACWSVYTNMLNACTKQICNVTFRCDLRLHIYDRCISTILMKGQTECSIFTHFCSGGHAHVYICHISWGQFYHSEYINVFIYLIVWCRNNTSLDIYIHNCRSLRK